MRLGDLDALMAKFLDEDADTAAEKEMNQVCRYLIRHTPTIDAVLVVRCKDCKHSDEDDFDGSLWCCRDKEIEVAENHFCSYGERKGE